MERRGRREHRSTTRTRVDYLQDYRNKGGDELQALVNAEQGIDLGRGTDWQERTVVMSDENEKNEHLTFIKRKKERRLTVV